MQKNQRPFSPHNGGLNAEQMAAIKAIYPEPLDLNLQTLFPAEFAALHSFALTLGFPPTLGYQLRIYYRWVRPPGEGGYTYPERFLMVLWDDELPWIPVLQHAVYKEEVPLADLSAIFPPKVPG